MQKCFEIGDELFREVKKACGAITDVEVVHQGLRALVHHAASQRLRALMGSEPDADLEDVPRRREKPLS